MSMQRCCPETAVYDRDLTDEATLFKALADPMRVAVLATLARAEHEVCVCDFTRSRSQSEVLSRYRPFRRVPVVKVGSIGVFAPFRRVSPFTVGLRPRPEGRIPH